MSRNKQLGLVFSLLCLTGFLYQVIEISVLYFSFPTSTKVILELEGIHSKPSVVFCAQFIDILDRTYYEKYGIRSEQELLRDRSGHDSIERELSVLTVQDIFDLTPKVNKVMQGCRLRRNSYQLTPYDLEFCRKIFHINKYIQGKYLCYQFLQNNSFDCELASQSHSSSNDLYEVSFERFFTKSVYLKLFAMSPTPGVLDKENLPYSSRRFYSFIGRIDSNGTNTTAMNAFFIKGDAVKVTRLEAPYDSFCTKNRSHSYKFCFISCRQLVYRTFGLVAHDEMVQEVFDDKLKVISPFDFLNQTLLDSLQEKMRRCLLNCRPGAQCLEIYSLTTLEPDSWMINSSISITASCPRQASTIINYIPNLLLLDFIVYISSSIGIWFGISFIHMNPFETIKLTNMIKRKGNGIINTRNRIGLNY